jgi:uncharacterized protein YgiM (DUF1202 family)
LAIFLTVFIIAALSSSSLKLSAQGGAWEARFWNNRNLTGNSVLTRQDASINFDWGGGSPAPQVFTDNFSVQWTQTANLPAGTYRFSATADDGMRVLVDNVPIIDAWYDSQVRTIVADVFLSAGNHNIVVQYYEAGGLAVAKMGFVQISGQPQPPPPTNTWFNEYFTNTSLSGAPTLTGTTSAVNFNWGSGTPTPGFPADFFSVRFIRNVPLEQARYRFTVTADDGVRVWVNNSLIIDQWRVQGATTFNAEIDVPAGNVPVKVEYFENTGLAKVQLNWTKAAVVPPAGPYTAEYFNNTGLSGAPVLVRGESSINNNWGFGSPAAQVPVDRFSARWTATLSVTPGRYRFTTTNDDGVRLWVNNQIIIDAWFDQPARTYTAEYDVSGPFTVRIEYYENINLAEMRFSYTPVSGQPGTGGQFPGTATVTSFKLNVRKGPSTAFAIITKLNTGQVVNLTGLRTGDSAWVQVALPDGTKGWVSTAYIKTSIPVSSLTPVTPTTPPTQPPVTGATGTVVTGMLNVRTGPGAGYPSFTTISNGTQVTLLGRNAAATWAKVILPDGRQGWVNASFLSTSVPVINLPVLNI